MSIRTAGAKEWGQELPDGTECFYCYQPIKLIAVFWMGHDSRPEIGGELWLHPECTVELMIRLIRDVHEVECGTHNYVARPRA